MFGMLHALCVKRSDEINIVKVQLLSGSFQKVCHYSSNDEEVGLTGWEEKSTVTLFT